MGRFDSKKIRQSELFAVVEGKTIKQAPLDLYIPADALEVILEAFEGPLDLLLYLIKRQNLDILDIQVAEITRQYMDYIDLMQELQFELAAEYLLMAAMLVEIKSRMLLPRQGQQEEDEDDPRAELVRRLREYESFKQAAMDIDALDRKHRDYWTAAATAPETVRQKPLPDIQLKELLVVLARALKRAETFSSHHITLDPLSTRERMSDILDMLNQSGDQFMPFMAMFKVEEGRAGIIVSFNAMMELMKEQLIEIVQTSPYAPIHIKRRSAEQNS